MLCSPLPLNTSQLPGRLSFGHHLLKPKRKTARWGAIFLDPSIALQKKKKRAELCSGTFFQLEFTRKVANQRWWHRR